MLTAGLPASSRIAGRCWEIVATDWYAGWCVSRIWNIGATSWSAGWFASWFETGLHSWDAGWGSCWIWDIMANSWGAGRFLLGTIVNCWGGRR